MKKCFKASVQKRPLVLILILGLTLLMAACGTGSDTSQVSQDLMSQDQSKSQTNEKPLSQDSVSQDQASVGQNQASANESDSVRAHVPDVSEVDYPIIEMVSDTHILAPTLHEENETFRRFYESGDGKLVQYSDVIFDAFIEEVKAAGAQYIIISGDLTTNGEKDSHQWLADQLEGLYAETGIKALVIPGNHDINNPYALSFLDGKRQYVDTVTPDDFKTIYQNCGYDLAVSKDPNSLSYLAKLSDKVYALMLDSCIYDNNQNLGYPVTGGKLSLSTLNWIESLQFMIPEGAKIFSVSHHNLLTHAEMLSNGYTLYNDGAARDSLHKVGISLNFSGHIHTQDVKVSQVDDFADVVTGCLTQHPQDYAQIVTSQEGLTYETYPVDVRAYAKNQGLSDDFLLDFDKAAAQLFYDQSYEMVSLEDLMDIGFSEEEASQMADVVARLNGAYFAGQEVSIKDDILNSKGYALWQEADVPFMKPYIEEMMKDTTPGDHFEWTW